MTKNSTETPKDEDALIQMCNIVKIFKTPVGDFPALRGIDVEFHGGEFISVVGKSGSGKSTLVNMITGIDRPTSGEVKVQDTYIHTLNESQMAKWRGRNLGIVFQFYQLLPMLSLLENVILPMDFCDMYAPETRESRAMALLTLVGLEEHAHKMPAAVSGGQQQSAAIARALANDPPIIIADEPTGNLDSHAAAAIFDIFDDLVARGKTIIMVTHDNALAQRASRTLVLADGEIVDQVIRKPTPAKKRWNQETSAALAAASKAVTPSLPRTSFTPSSEDLVYAS
jgi:putative ABC transport system ATP-binding protein